MSIQRALISVSDKTGVVALATALHEQGVALLSTGGTHRTLANAGLPVREVSKELGAALEKLGAKATITEEDILTAWAQVVPPIISGNTRPSGLRDGVLEISVLQPAILYTLESQMKGEILKRLQTLFGKRHVRRLRFRIG